MPTYTIVYRGTKGSPLTNTEVDNNFQNLDTYKAPIDAPQFTTSAQVTGQLTAISATGALIASNGTGTGQTSIQLKRVGAAVDQKTYEINSDSSGAFVIRSVNDAYSQNAPILTATRGSTYTMATLTLMSAGGRVLVGSGADDGVNAFQVTGNIESDSSIKLTGATSGIEVGSLSSSNTPFVDFHSSGNNIDYDARIAGSNGSTTVGAGTLTYYAGSNYWNTVNGTVMLLNSLGRLMIGTTTDDGSNLLQVNGGIAAYNGGGSFTTYGSYAPVRMRASGGTQGSPTALGNTTQIGGVNFNGYDGSTWNDVATVGAYTEEAWTTTAHGAGLRWSVTKAGTTTQAEAMRLNNRGALLIGQTGDDGVRLVQIAGGVGIAASGTTPGLLLTGPTVQNSGLYLSNTTATTGRMFSVVTGPSGSFSINDETAGTLTRIAVVGGANRVLLAGATDDGTTNGVLVGGSLTATGALNSGTSMTVGTSLQVGNTTVTSTGVEIGGIKTTTANIDFHSYGGATLNDYDSRILATGGSSASSQGTLAFYGGALNLHPSNSLVNINTTTSLSVLRLNANGYQPMIRSNGTTSTIEFINSANTAVNMTVFDNGNVTVRTGLTTPNFTCTSTSQFNAQLTMAGYAQIALSGPAYTAYMRADSGGLVGFINNAGTQWNLMIYDDGHQTVRGTIYMNGGAGQTFSNASFFANGNASNVTGQTVSWNFGAISIQAIAASAFLATSDRRLKTEIETIDADYAIKFVKEVNPKFYLKEGRPEHGFIAQDVAKWNSGRGIVMVSLTDREGLEETVDEDGFTSPNGKLLSLDDKQIISIHQSVLQNLLARVEALEAEVASLKAQ